MFSVRVLPTLLMHLSGFIATFGCQPLCALAEGTQDEKHLLMSIPQYASSLAASPEEEHLLHGGMYGQLQTRDAETNEVLKTYKGHTDDVVAAVFSPDGRYILSGSRDKSARLWDAASGEMLRVLIKHSSAVGAVAFSPCQQYFAVACGDGFVFVWDARTYALLHVFEPAYEGKAAMSIAFSPSGSSIVVGFQTGHVQLWQLENEELLWGREAHRHWVIALAFHPNGQYIVSGSTDGTAKVWTANSGELHTQFEQHGRQAVKWVQFRPDGKKVLSIGSDGGRLWDYSTGEQVLKTDSIGDSVNGAAVLEKRGLLAIGTASEISLWDLETGKRCCLEYFPLMPRS